jgi:DNA-binding transcriptional regulator YiaG
MTEPTYIDGVKFSDWIHRCRGLSGKTIPQYAEYLGVHVNTIRNWESGIAEPPRRAEVVCIEDVREKAEALVNQQMAEKYGG